jgi:hypothetical protein
MPVVTVTRLAGAASCAAAGAAAAAAPADGCAAAAVVGVWAHAPVEMRTATATPIPVAALTHVVISLLDPVARRGTLRDGRDSLVVSNLNATTGGAGDTGQIASDQAQKRKNRDVSRCFAACRKGTNHAGDLFAATFLLI